MHAHRNRVICERIGCEKGVTALWLAVEAMTEDVAHECTKLTEGLFILRTRLRNVRREEVCTLQGLVASAARVSASKRRSMLAASGLTDSSRFMVGAVGTTI